MPGVRITRSVGRLAHRTGTVLDLEISSAVVDGRTITVSVTLTRPTVLLGLVGRTTITSHGVARAQLVPVGAP